MQTQPMFRFSTATAVALLSFACLNPVHAQQSANKLAPPLSPGYWEITTRPEFPGVPMIPVPKTDKLCLTAEDIAAGRIQARSAPGCKIAGGKWTGASLQLEIVCSDAPVGAKMVGQLMAGDKSITGEIELVSQPDQEGPAAGRMFYRHSGKWLAADCPGP